MQELFGEKEKTGEEKSGRIACQMSGDEKMRKGIAFLLCIAASIGVVAGCGQKKAEEPSQKGETAAQESVALEAAYKKEITVGTQGPIKTVDVQSGSNVYHNVLFRLTHDSLVYPNEETGKIEPRLAKEWTWVDDRTIEFKLRDDVVFHNGEK